MKVDPHTPCKLGVAYRIDGLTTHTLDLRMFPHSRILSLSTLRQKPFFETLYWYAGNFRLPTSTNFRRRQKLLVKICFLQGMANLTRYLLVHGTFGKKSALCVREELGSFTELGIRHARLVHAHSSELDHPDMFTTILSVRPIFVTHTLRNIIKFKDRWRSSNVIFHPLSGISGSSRALPHSGTLDNWREEKNVNADWTRVEAQHLFPTSYRTRIWPNKKYVVS